MKTKETIYEKVSEHRKITREQNVPSEYQKGLTGQRPPLDYQDYNEALTAQKPPLERSQTVIVQTSGVSEPIRQTASEESSKSSSFLESLWPGMVQTSGVSEPIRQTASEESSKSSSLTDVKSVGFFGKMGCRASAIFTLIKRFSLKLIRHKSSGK